MMRCETRNDNRKKSVIVVRYASIDSGNTQPLNRRFTMKYLPFSQASLCSEMITASCRINTT